jgi:hypothetical protein
MKKLWRAVDSDRVDGSEDKDWQESQERRQEKALSLDGALWC